MQKKENINMKHESFKKIKSLRWYHATIIILSIFGILAIIFMDNWNEMVVWLPLVVAICLDGKFEKTDELAKHNLSKANTVTMWILFAVLCELAMSARFHVISVKHILVAMFSAIAIGSILFIIFDISFLGKEESNA